MGMEAILETLRKLREHPEDTTLYEKVRKMDTKKIPIPSDTHADYVPPDPRTTDGPTFVRGVMARPEFAMHAFTQSWKPTEGSFFLTPNQEFLKTFLSPYTPYKSIMLYHQVGVGKTCAAIQIAENFRKLPMYQKVRVLAPSIIQRQFTQQVFQGDKYDVANDRMNQCVPYDYVQKIGARETLHRKDPEAFEKRGAELVKQVYQLSGYLQFANEVAALAKGRNQAEYARAIRKRYSHMVLIIDEVHNIRSEVANRERPEADQEDVDDPDLLAEAMVTPTAKKEKEVTRRIQDVLTYAEDVRLVILTATPIFHDTQEMMWIINFIRTNEGQPPLPRKQALSPEVLKEFAQKYVSFMRGENPDTFPTRLYPSVHMEGFPYPLQAHPTKTWDQKEISEKERVQLLPLVVSEMSAKHAEAVSAARQKDKDSPLRPLQAGNVYYPGGLVGREGFRKVFTITENNPEKFQVAYRAGKEGWFHPSKLETHSPKIHRIVESCKRAKGLVLVYTQFIDAGIYPLAVALEEAGFTRDALDKGQILQTKSEGTPSLDMSYAMITGAIPESSKWMQAMFRRFANANNRDGKKLKVLLITSKGTEGLDLKAIREVHIMEPWFNLSRLEQVVGRAVRNRSHVSLPPKKRNVSIFYHAALFPSERESPDYRIYRLAEDRQRKISAIERTLKSHSLDCHLNHTQHFIQGRSPVSMEHSWGGTLLVDINDKDGSRICDYDRCDFTCVPEILEAVPMNQTAIPTVFFSYDIGVAKHHLRGIFGDAPTQAFSYQELLHQYQNRTMGNALPRQVFHHALQEMIDKQERVPPGGTLLYRGGRYLFQPATFDDATLLPAQRGPVPPRKVAKKATLRYLVKQQKRDAVADRATLEKVEQRRAELTAILEQMMASVYQGSASIPEIDPSIVEDMVLDRLDAVQFHAVMASALWGKEDGRWLASARRNGLVFSQPVMAYYSVHDNAFYCGWDETCDEVTSEALRRQLRPYVELDASRPGFSVWARNKTGTWSYKFKIQPPGEEQREQKKKSEGTECGSQYKKDTLKGWVLRAVQEFVSQLPASMAKEIVVNADFQGKIHERICPFYEYTLRVNQGEGYLRPQPPAHTRPPLENKKPKRT